MHKQQRGKYRYFTLYINTGQIAVYENGTMKKHIVSRSTGTSELEVVYGIGADYIKEFQNAWQDLYGGDGSAEVGADDNAGSIEEAILSVMQTFRREKGNGSTYKNYLSEAEAFLDLLGENKLLPPSAHTKAEFARIVVQRLRQLTTPGSRRQAIRKLKYICEHIPDLPEQCREAICVSDNAPPVPQSDFAFSDADIRAMSRHLPAASACVRALFWLGANGSQHWREVVFLKRREAKAWREQQRLGNRVKTGTAFMSFVWPEVFTSLQALKGEDDDVYVFPELVFTKEELEDTTRNKKELTPAEEASRAEMVKRRAAEVFDAWLKICGVKRPGISYRSFRYYNAGLTHSIKYATRTLLDYFGWADEQTLLRYARSANPVVKLGHFLRQHWLSVMAGEEPLLVQTLTEAVSILKETYEHQVGELRKELGAIKELLVGQLRRRKLPVPMSRKAHRNGHSTTAATPSRKAA